jgi:4-hydroxy-2-oxoglutarate aldolase
MALANIAAAPLSSLIAAFIAGEIEAARHIKLSLVDINAAITSRYGISGLKYAMDVLGYYGGPTRRPLLPLGDDAKAEIDRLINCII